MITPKGWDWQNAEKARWLEPSEDCYYFADIWAKNGFKKILDLGTGLGRHAVFFAQKGFDVSAIDISEYGINHLNSWAQHEKLQIDTKIGDIESLPYEENSFDCIFAYHVISHTDGNGIVKIMSELERILKPNGQIFVTMCSKQNWAFNESGYKKIDPNTIIDEAEGPEQGVPHYHVDLDDILGLFKNFDIDKVRHTHYCYIDHEKTKRMHYYISAKLK